VNKDSNWNGLSGCVQAKRGRDLVRCALGNVNVERLLDLGLAEDGALTTAFIAVLLDLLDHGTHPNGLNLVPLSPTGAATLDATLLVYHLARQPQRARTPFVELLEGHLQGVHHRLTLFHAGPLFPLAAGEDIEDITRPISTTTILQTFLAVLVVDLALSLITKNVKSLLDLKRELAKKVQEYNRSSDSNKTRMQRWK